MKKLPFDLTKALAGAPVVTRHGKEIIRIERLENPIRKLAIKGYFRDTGLQAEFTECGRFYNSGLESMYDLFLLDVEFNKESKP